MLEHSCFYSLPPLFTILQCLFPSSVHADIERTIPPYSSNPVVHGDNVVHQFVTDFLKTETT